MEDDPPPPPASPESHTPPVIPSNQDHASKVSQICKNAECRAWITFNSKSLNKQIQCNVCGTIQQATGSSEEAVFLYEIKRDTKKTLYWVRIIGIPVLIGLILAVAENC